MKPIIIIAIAVVLLIPISAYATGHYQEAGTMYPEDAKAVAAEMILEDIPISVWTDKTDYTHNDFILVTGKVITGDSEFFVTVTVVSPLNSVVTINQVQVNTDGIFLTTLNTAGALWKYDGTYTIKAIYGSAEISNKAKVELSGGVTFEPDYSTPESEVLIIGTDKISYDKGEEIIVSGYTNAPTIDVTFRITINENIVDISQVPVDVNGNFVVTFPTSTKIWKESGTYTINATQGGSIFYDKSITFDFDASGFVDILPPEITTPDTLELVSSTSDGSVVTFSVHAIDKVDGVIPTSCSHNSGFAFPIGTTTVTCSATDNSGNSASKSFIIIVTSKEPEPTPESKELGLASFVDKSKDPQSYIDRYNNEPIYKKWFHENFPQYDSIQQAVGLELTQKIPSWVKNIFLWYGQDQVSEDELLNAIQFLIDEGILVVN